MAAGPIWPVGVNQWFYSDYTPYSYDPEKAKSLLAEAGYPDGFDITLQCISREPDNTIMQIVQQQLAAVGINVKLESMERLAWVDLYTKQLGGQLGLAKMTYPRVDAYVQLNTNMGGTSSNNYSQYKGRGVQQAAGSDQAGIRHGSPQGAAKAGSKGVP